MTSANLSSAQRFADERNTHRVIVERALDLEHAGNLLDLLELQSDQIDRRYTIGATSEVLDDRTIITFVDGSRAQIVHSAWRWTATAA